MTRMRAGLTLLILAAFLAGGAQSTVALADDLLSTGTTTASGATGVQSATACPTPRLSGLPKRPKFTNATIKFKLTNLTVGATYLIRAGGGEVLGGAVQTPTVKSSFLLPDQGVKDRKTTITAIVDTQNCSNAPWKLEKRIRYKATATATPAPTTPAAGAPPAAAPTPAPAAAVKPPVTAVKPLKAPKPTWQTVPHLGTPLSQRTWMVPIDGAARMVQGVPQPKLSRLEQKTDTASSSNALVGLGLIALLFVFSTIVGLWVFVHRDEVAFEAAMSYQLRHLEEGDFNLMPDEEPYAPPLAASGEAPFAEPAPTLEEPAPVASVAAPEIAPTPVPAPTPAETMHHRAAVEAELQRVLSEAGLETELQGILADARTEAERQGVALDTDLMLQALCEEINGSAKLSDVKREELRTMFAGIIAEEAKKALTPEGVATS